jgi:hypothetical protein
VYILLIEKELIYNRKGSIFKDPTVKINYILSFFSGSTVLFIGRMGSTPSVRV